MFALPIWVRVAGRIEHLWEVCIFKNSTVVGVHAPASVGWTERQKRSSGRHIRNVSYAVLLISFPPDWLRPNPVTASYAWHWKPSFMAGCTIQHPSMHGVALISDLQTRQDFFLREVIHFMTLSVTLPCSPWNPCYAFSVWDHIGASHFGPAVGTLSLCVFTREFTVSTKNSAYRKQAHWKALSLGSIPG